MAIGHPVKEGLFFMNKTVTDSRVKQALYGHFKTFLDGEKIPEQITRSIEEHSIKSGKVLEVYHFLDKSLVKLSNGEEVEAWHLHRCLGSIVDLYTPEGEQVISERKNEPCIIPKFELKSLVAEVGKDEYVLLGFYNPNMVGAFSPADKGTYIIKTLTDTSQGGLTVSPQEIKLTSNNGAFFTERDMGVSNEIIYADSKNTYTKNEVYKKTQTYNKEEVYSKSQTYNKDDVYRKAQTYNKTEVDAFIQEIWDYIDPPEEDVEDEDNGG